MKDVQWDELRNHLEKYAEEISDELISARTAVHRAEKRLKSLRLFIRANIPPRQSA